jgi:LruC domain-containing protein
MHPLAILHSVYTSLRLPTAVGFAALLCGASTAWAQSAPSLGNAQSFAVLGGSSVTVAGTGTVITGNVGVSPGTSITGFPAGATTVPPYATHANDAAAIDAQSSTTALYTDLANTGSATVIAAELGGTTRGPGTYSFSSTANIAAGTTLTLSGAGVYIFKVGSAITANVLSNVVLQNSATAEQVFWQVTSAATLNGTTFSGTVVAQAAITLGAGATLNGRALTTAAGAVTMAGGNTVIAPALDGFTHVPTSVVTSIGNVLPEWSNAGAAYMSGNYTPNLVIDEPAEIKVILVWEGSGYRNSLGWFRYAEGAEGGIDILGRGLLKANCSFPSSGSMTTGETYELRDADGSVRTFQPGDRVGFFLVADGFDTEPVIASWNAASSPIPSSTASVNAGFGRGCYTTIDRINPERAQGSVEFSRHVAMLWFPPEPGFLGGEPFLVAGFEDLDRLDNSDEDFNDLVFIVTASPIEALSETAAFRYQPGDPDGDGVEGVSDYFPDDPTRANITRNPSQGEHVVAFEDQYPLVGDADYNDVVMALSTQTVTNAAGQVRDLQVTYHLVARGASHDHLVGLHLPDLPGDANGTLEIERWLSDATQTHEVATPRTLADLVAANRRISDIFPSTYLALPPLPGATFANTQAPGIDRPAASSRVKLTFDTAIDAAALGLAPFDLYLGVKHGSEVYDVHLPGQAGFDDRPVGLPLESGPNSFRDASGRPWALQVPASWQFPREHVPVWVAYPDFAAWASSGGASSGGWYLQPSGDPTDHGFAIQDYVPVKAWTVELPGG